MEAFLLEEASCWGRPFGPSAQAVVAVEDIPV